VIPRRRGDIRGGDANATVPADVAGRKHENPMRICPLPFLAVVVMTGTPSARKATALVQSRRAARAHRRLCAGRQAPAGALACVEKN
jgi:hypothetical protein